MKTQRIDISFEDSPSIEIPMIALHCVAPFDETFPRPIGDPSILPHSKHHVNL